MSLRRRQEPDRLLLTERAAPAGGRNAFRHTKDTDMTCRLLVTVPVYAQVELTHALLPDILKEARAVDLLVVDNGGNYTPLGDERVIRPGTNIGWAAASNLGFRIAFRNGYSHAMTLNNDTRLSHNFFAGLLDSRLPEDAGLVGPMYDEKAWRTQAAEYRGPAADYPASDHYRSAAVADGTGLCMRIDAWEAVGGLDERTFGKFSWGADADLSIRVRRAGFGVYITERSFLNHFGRKTASALVGETRYVVKSQWDLRKGMRRIYGKRWRTALDSYPSVRCRLQPPSELPSRRNVPAGRSEPR